MLTRYQFITICFWLVSELYWGFHAKGNKEVIHRQKTFVRTFALISVYLAFALIYVPYFSAGFFAVRVIPNDDFFGIIGVLLCGFGISFSIWSRRTLGKNWSGPATLKKDHELIRHGPYQDCSASDLFWVVNLVYGIGYHHSRTTRLLRSPPGLLLVVEKNRGGRKPSG